MNGTFSKLEINIPYLLFTNNDTIISKKVKVVGILNYEQAKEVNYSVTGLAINEKVVGTEYATTEEYLKEQYFYKLISYNDKDNEKNTNEVYVVWDDVIDLSRTTRLSSIYKYQMTLEVNAELDQSLNSIIAKIMEFILSEFNQNAIPTIVQTQVVGQNNTKLLLEEYQRKFEDAKSIINKMATLKQIETLIDALANSNLLENVNEINTKMEGIAASIAGISDMLA